MPRIDGQLIDPTRLLTLRRQYAAAVNARFDRVAKAIWRSLVMEDDAGLVSADLTLADMLALGQQRAQVSDAPTFNVGAYKFESEAGKVAAFSTWLDVQVQANLLQPGGSGNQFGNDYLGSAYKAGIVRGHTEANAAKLTAASEIQGGTRGQFLAQSFNLPIRKQTLERLYTRSYHKLKGYTDQMSSDASAAMADALANGRGAKDTAKLLMQKVGLAKSKAMRLARTELTFAQAEGQLDSYEIAGVKHVDVLAEWSTAGDNNVCSLCSTLNGLIITVAQARGLIPRHPNCRCAWRPALNIDTTSKKILGSDKLKQIQKSIEAEHRKGGTAWTGADLTPTDTVQLGPKEQWQQAQARRAASRTISVIPTPDPVVPPVVTPRPVPPKPRPVRPKPAPVPVVAPKPLPVAIPPVPVRAAVDVVAKPTGITFTGTQTETTHKIWAAIGPDGIRDATHAKQVGKLVMEEAFKGKEYQQALQAYADIIAERDALIVKMQALKDKRGNITDWPAYSKFMQEREAWAVKRKAAADAMAPYTGQIHATLKQVRDLGGQLRFASGSDAKAKQVVQESAKYLPADWIKAIADQKALKARAVKRGSYDPRGTGTIKVSGISKHGIKLEDALNCGVHELTHGAEYAVPKIAKLERQYLDSRLTPGEKKRHLGKGYRADEYAYEDKLMSHYMGKTYDEPKHINAFGGPAYEIMTMGTQDMLRDTDPNVLLQMQKDPDYFQFVLGIAAGL